MERRVFFLFGLLSLLGLIKKVKPKRQTSPRAMTPPSGYLVDRMLRAEKCLVETQADIEAVLVLLKEKGPRRYFKSRLILTRRKFIIRANEENVLNEA